MQQLVQQNEKLTAVAQPLGVQAEEGEQRGFLGTVFNNPVVRTVVDVISRPNYAVAGIADELLQHNSLEGAMGRAFNEIFSGIGGIRGDKRAFGEVLERAGYGTVTLGQLVPALEGTWVGNFGSRGAAGLALDIALDPLTYVTFGASSAGKTAFRDGVTRYLSKHGLDEFASIRSNVRSGYAVELAQHADDPVKLVETERLIDDIAGDEFLKRNVDVDGALPARLSDPGGVKFMGASVMPERLYAHLPSKTAEMLKRVPGGRFVAETSVAFGDALAGATSRLLSPFHALRDAPPEMRNRAIALHRDTTHARANVEQRMRQIMLDGDEKLGVAPKLRQRYLAEAKKDELLGNKLYSIRENAKDPLSGKKYTLQDLTKEQLIIHNDMSALVNAMRRTMVEHGIFTNKQLPLSYYPHAYLNAEELRGVHSFPLDKLDSRISSSFTRERVHETYWDAVSTSKSARTVGQAANLSGKPHQLRPILEPNYNLLENVDNYVTRYADALARNSWNRQVINEFGRPLSSEVTGSMLFDLTQAQTRVAGKDAALIAKLTLRGGRKVAPTGPLDFRWMSDTVPKGSRSAREATAVTEIKQTLDKLTPSGREALISRLLQGTSGEADLTILLRDLYPDYAAHFPSHLHSEGELAAISYGKLYGEGANWTKVHSDALTGGKPFLVPRAIVDDLTRIDRDVLLDKSKMGQLHGLVRAYDKVTALARLGVYSAWIPSAIRDAYNNVALSMFDVGLSALSPSQYKRTVELMAGRAGTFVTKNGERYTYDELRQLAHALGVLVPGRVFAEGAKEQTGRLSRGLAAFADKRGSVENAGRLQLWLNNINRGVNPREAARHVTDFLFDYGEISPFFRSFMRRAFFFPTFTLKNVPFWARELRRNPGLAVNQLKPFRGRTSDEREMLGWQADQLRLRLDGDGRTLHVLEGMDLPITNLDTLWGGGVGKTGRKWMSMLAPVPRTTFEQIAGTNLLTGRPLSRAQGQALGALIDVTPTPKPIKDWLGYRKELDPAGRPSYSFDERRYGLLVRSWMASRVASASDRVWRDTLANSDKGALWAMMESFVVGVRYNEIDMEETKRRKLATRVAQLRDELRRRGYVASRPGELE